MAVKRNKSRKGLSYEMTHEALADSVQEVDVDLDTRDEEDASRGPATRRPMDPVKDSSDRVSLLTRAEQVMRIAASLGVATAAILAVIEYSNANEDNRRERALEIVRDWQTEANTDRYTAVQEFVEAKVTEPALQASLGQLSERALADAQTNLGRAWTTTLRNSSEPAEQALERDIDRLMLFFAQMEICISSQLCNAEVLQAYFELEVSSFWKYFKGYAELRQDANYEGYGEPVERLVTRFAAMSDP